MAAVGAVVASLLLASCGSGGDPGDVNPNASSAATEIVSGPNSFLLFPNPIVLADSSWQINTAGYAQAYYAAIDPANAKDTLAKWKAANGFGTAPGPLGEVTIAVGDTRDLGYGRRMTARQNSNGTIAVLVDNYVVSPATASYGSYTHLNVEAAAVQDKRWFIGTTAIEYSPAPGVAPGINCLGCFAKFSFFLPNGNRALMADLDGRGPKAMPGICINCHGGRAGPLTPATGSQNGQQLFPLIQNSVSLARGDVQGRLHDLKVHTFDYSTMPGYTRADQEVKLKAINKIVLCTYPLAAPTSFSEDACRPAAGANEWQGGNDVFIKNSYGGNGMPNATYNDTYVPPGWLNAGQTSLYQNVMVDYCRTCHILRGTIGQSDVDFTDTSSASADGYTKFAGYAERIYDHVFNIGNMPLAKFVADRFWSGSAPDMLANWVQAQSAAYVARDGTGTVLKPGRPVAEPGPDRVVPVGSTVLSGVNSRFATSYGWSFVSNPGGATLTNANTATPTFTATVSGTYVLQLVVGNGSALSAPLQQTVVVNSALAPLPSAIRFANIKTVLQGICTACHTAPALTAGATTPIVYNQMDRNGDGVIDATDDAWLYAEVRGRINFTDIDASPLLRKPSGYHHNGALQAGFNAAKPPGDPARANYDLFLNWILNGAPL